MTAKDAMIPTTAVAQRILLLRGQKVMVDADLAELYGVETKALNQAVKRNLERFPREFMFQLSKVEKGEVVTNCDHLAQLKYSPVLPYAFTEHGSLMLGNVFNPKSSLNVKQHKMEPKTPSNSPLSGGELTSSPDKGRPGGVWGKRWSNLARRFIIRGLLPCPLGWG